MVMPCATPGCPASVAGDEFCHQITVYDEETFKEYAKPYSSPEELAARVRALKMEFKSARWSRAAFDVHGTRFYHWVFQGYGPPLR